jgi:TonB family protein
MKSLAFNFRLALPALLCCVALARTASAQEAAPSWVKISPPNEAFTVLMPGQPSSDSERRSSGTFKVAGQRYRVRREEAEYTVWSFEAARPPEPHDDRMAYLDQCREIARHVIVKQGWLKPKRGSLTDERPLSFYGLPSMRYRINMGKQFGMAHIYTVGAQIYIVAAWGAAHESASVEEFVKSFSLNLPVPEAPVRAPTGAGVDAGAGVGPGRGWGPGSDNARVYGVGNGDVREPGGGGYSRVYTAREVTQQAQLLKRPEPAYTEGAREERVTGKVRVRLILWPSGKVSHIRVISRLPHGLTWEAIEAARRIKFTPAMKDGRAVAQYVRVDYNFNIY